jgi:uncharacterized protein (TIGR02996 family)
MREALEAAIRANRDDGAAYDVYADYLIAHGEPHGELIALERRLEHSDSAAMRARANELIAALVAWSGDPDISDHAFHTDFKLRWRWGLWDAVAISCSSGMKDGSYDCPALAHYAFAHPACIALRELHYDLHDWRFRRDVELPPVLAAAEGHAWARELRSLVLGAPPHGEWGSLNNSLGETGAAISRIFPRLATLALWANQFGLAALDLPVLDQLAIRTAALSRAHVAELCARAVDRRARRRGDARRARADLHGRGVAEARRARDLQHRARRRGRGSDGGVATRIAPRPPRSVQRCARRRWRAAARTRRGELHDAARARCHGVPARSRRDRCARARVRRRARRRRSPASARLGRRPQRRVPGVSPRAAVR